MTVDEINELVLLKNKSQSIRNMFQHIIVEMFENRNSPLWDKYDLCYFKRVGRQVFDFFLVLKENSNKLYGNCYTGTLPECIERMKEDFSKENIPPVPSDISEKLQRVEEIRSQISTLEEELDNMQLGVYDDFTYGEFERRKQQIQGDIDYWTAQNNAALSNENNIEEED